MAEELDRKQFLSRSGIAVAAVAGFASLEDVSAGGELDQSLRHWSTVRRQFQLDPRLIHLGAFLLASHPIAVRRAIERHRRRFDANPVDYLHEHWAASERRVLGAASGYLGAKPEDIALTDSTTMGLSLLYAGLDVRPGQELLTTTHDFFVTHAALETKARRSAATVRKISLYDRPESASESEIVDRIATAVRPETRVVAITWVHSSTGVKLPLRKIADALGRLNAGRAKRDRVLLCVDGVHGFGVENVEVAKLGCDFFATGCHKWLFGPRGTGLVWGAPSAWPAATSTIPSFTGSDTPGAANSPGGFHSFEHRWALAEGFLLHRQIGKSRIAARTHALNQRFKDGLARMSNVVLHTPRASSLSAGLVCFEVDGLSPNAVVSKLRSRRIVATVTPYSPSYARVAPSILNTPAEVDLALDAIRALR
jgi:selenocysteine lyase/cysteine desulfurase